ncbi:MAG: hypothetical protein PHI79_08105, partial [Sulfurovaceae bacterium]|nr:hypothetical protein [Sulfurovaceae bacterium]
TYPNYAHLFKTIIVRDDGIYARTNKDVSQEYKEVSGNFFSAVESPENMNFTYLEKNNIWKPFDGKNYSFALGNGNIEYTVSADNFTCIALGKVVGTHINIVFKNEIGNIISIVDKNIDTSLGNTDIQFGKTFIYYCEPAKTAVITITGTQIGTISLAKKYDLGATNLALKHGITSYSRFKFDEFGNPSFVERPTAITYSGSCDILMNDYDDVLRFFQYIDKKEVVIDGTDNNNESADGKNFLNSTSLIGRFMTVDQETQIKNEDIDQIAKYTFSVLEII